MIGLPSAAESCICNRADTEVNFQTILNSYPVPAVTSIGLSSTSDVISFDQNWHHLYSTAAGRKNLSNNTQIRVVGLMEPEICTKTLKKLSEKLRANFPPLLDMTRRGYSLVKIARLDDVLLEVF